MSLRRIFAGGTAAILGLALAASTVFAAVGNQNPNLTVQLTLNPTVVTAPGKATAYAAITNNTSKTNNVAAEIEVTAPSGATVSYYKTLAIKAGKTVSYSVTYRVPYFAEKGVYTVILSGTDTAGTSSATEYLTVQ